MEMPQIKIKETIEHRYLGALRLVDGVTGHTVRRKMLLSAAALKLQTNASGLHVIVRANGLERHLTAFEQPPDTPAVGTVDFALQIRDPLGEYLERTAIVSLPRDPDPEKPNTVFKAVDITLFPAPAAGLSLNWSVIRASVYDAEDMDARKPIPGALLRVVNGQGALLMSGLSDQRGEAVVIIPGIPISSFAGADEAPEEPDADQPDAEEEETPGLATGPVVETQTPATLEVIVRPEAPWPVNPNELEDGRAQWRRSFKQKTDDVSAETSELALKTGKMQHFEIYVDMPDGE